MNERPHLTHINDAEAPQFPMLSQAVIVEPGSRMMLISGQVGLDPDKKVPTILEGTEAQTTAAMDNISAILQKAGGTLGNLVGVEILHTDPGDIGVINNAFLAALAAEGVTEETGLPSRIATGAAFLPLGANVEIKGTAALPPQA